MSLRIETALPGYQPSNHYHVEMAKTTTRPEAEVILPDLAEYFFRVRAAAATQLPAEIVEPNSQPSQPIALSFFTSLAAKIHRPNTHWPGDFPLYPTDLDLACPDHLIDILAEIIPTVKTANVSYFSLGQKKADKPPSIPIQTLDNPLFPQINSRKLEYKLAWTDPLGTSWIYGVEIFDNHNPQFIKALLDTADFLTEDEVSRIIDNPVQEVNGHQVWHPVLSYLLYYKLASVDNQAEAVKADERPSHFTHRAKTVHHLRTILTQSK